MKTWTATDTSNGRYIGELEFHDKTETWHNFSVLECGSRLVFGGPTNNTFLESGYLEQREEESTDEALQELLSDLEVFYSDGPEYVSRIVFNERM